jgi:hypothetical protein
MIIILINESYFYGIDFFLKSHKAIFVEMKEYKKKYSMQLINGGSSLSTDIKIK